VTKEIACFLGTTNCGAFGKFAIGVQGDTQNPAFCYRISVTNCGNCTLTNVTVIDDKYGNLTADFPCAVPTLVPGAGCSFVFTVELDGASLPNNVDFVTNTVTASGTDTSAGRTVTAQDHAVAEIIPAGIMCQQLYTVDGGPLTNCIKLNVDSTLHTVVTYITVKNTGLADLLDVTITGDIPQPCGIISVPPFRLDSGASETIPLCTNASYICTNSVGTLMAVATEYAYGTNITLCAHDITGKVIQVRSECPGCVQCTQPNACRVTGGGRQDSPEVFPLDVRYVTHGGQVGAPVGDKICIVTPQFQMGNPCIHGRWTHVRHVQGGLDGNFHAEFYDTLDCACLDTNTTQVLTNVPGVDGAANQSYVNLVYGPESVVNGVCGDRSTGPLPRPAPANKIVFTGVGDWADPNGSRAPRSVLFRVDIEDRGEPGNSHALGADGKANRIPDRYRIRIWVLSDAELAELHGTGPDTFLLNFRNAISACVGINVQDGASVPNGTAAFGVRAPDIDDGGVLERGNHQIHPSIMACDPNNPKGPGLPNH
jgi:hypothetical protein